MGFLTRPKARVDGVMVEDQIGVELENEVELPEMRVFRPSSEPILRDGSI